MSVRPSPWPEATSELLPNSLFKFAHEYPDVIYAEYFSDPNDLAAGYRQITYRELANAVHATAWWIEKTVGRPKSPDGSKTMVYLGENDFRYGIVALASVMVGYKMLFPSPRYGAAAIARLIDQVSSKIMLTSDIPLPVVEPVLQQYPMRTYALPSQAVLFEKDTQPYPFTKTFAQHRHEPLVVLHTSGTTGFPKPIIWSHDWADSYVRSFNLSSPPVTEMFRRSDRRVMFLFPPFHASGIVRQLLLGITNGLLTITPPGAATPGEIMERMADALEFLMEREEQGRRVDVLALPPPHAEYLGTHPALLDRIVKTAKVVLFSGGDISLAAGTAIASKMQLTNDIGSTELGLWPSLVRSEDGTWNGEKVEDLWRYVPLHPALNIRLDPVADSPEGALCEAIMVHNPEHEWVQPIFKIFPDSKEKSLGDVFIRHPHHPGLWKHAGRIDDLLNFSTSEKFHPVAAETKIAGHPHVEECMMVGTRRPRASLIVRLKERAGVEGVKGVWELVQKVNVEMPVYARIERDMILVVEEAFPKTAKGSVRKKGVVERYENEVEEMYKVAAGGA
ncbi:acetyl-CoA synthetase-like protein [Ophiobolus disseminans]|uniref:Acetyl-CoA synthetase-like protein n=1 Tax=Ophiobolus disseminans TaxID=1469910 RepID=A0A6A6ZV36_9PLEO|nr:acetyl-CoA synthetase-like protein [Ophiobolus disseminans]